MKRPPPQTQAEREVYAYKLACKTWQGYVSRLGVDAKNFDLDDLLGAAMYGAALALAKFDSSRGTKFSSFAIALIRGAILEEARRQDYLKRDLRALAKEIEAETGEVPLWALRPQSLDEMIPLEGAPVFRHEMVADETVNVEAEVLERLETETLWAWVSLFPRREREVLERYYRDDETPSRIKKAMGISESRVFQLRQNGLERLREWMTAP